jgi:hypothetical protein
MGYEELRDHNKLRIDLTEAIQDRGSFRAQHVTYSFSAL